MKKLISSMSFNALPYRNQLDRAIDDTVQRIVSGCQPGEPIGIRDISGIMAQILESFLDTLAEACPFENKKNQTEAQISIGIDNNKRFLQDLEDSLNRGSVANNFKVHKKLDKSVFAYLTNNTELNNREQWQESQIDILLQNIVSASQKSALTAKDDGLLNAIFTRILLTNGKTGITDLAKQSLYPDGNGDSESMRDVLLRMPKMAEILTRFGDHSCEAVLTVLQEKGQQKRNLIRLYIVARVRQAQAAGALFRMSEMSLKETAPRLTVSSTSHQIVSGLTESTSVKSDPIVPLNELVEQAQRYKDGISDLLPAMAADFNEKNRGTFSTSPVSADQTQMERFLPYLLMESKAHLKTMNTEGQRKELVNQFLTGIQEIHEKPALATQRNRHMVEALVARLLAVRTQNSDNLKHVIREVLRTERLLNQADQICLSIAPNEAMVLARQIDRGCQSHSDGYLINDIFHLKTPPQKYTSLTKDLTKTRLITYTLANQAGKNVIVGRILERLQLPHSPYHHAVVTTVIEERGNPR
jgi:hypothetical protein